MLLVIKILLLASFGSSTKVWAGYHEGLNALRHGDYETALQEFLPAAELGDVEAQFVLFSMYAREDGVDEDLDKGSHWLTQAIKTADLCIASEFSGCE